MRACATTERLHVARAAPGLLRDQLGQRVRRARDEFAFARAQGRATGDDPHRRRNRLRALGIGERLRTGEHEAAKRREHGLALGARPYGIDERGLEVPHPPVEQVFLRREVVEDGAA